MRKLCYFLTWIYFFTVPWDHSLVFEGLGPVSRVITIVAIPFVIMAVAVQGEMRRVKPVHLFMLAFFLVSGATFFWTVDQDATLIAIRTYLQVTIAVWIAWEFAPDCESQRKLALAYMLGAYVSIVNTFWQFSSSAHLTRGIERFNAEGWDQNDLAVALALGILISRYACCGSSRLIRLLAYLYVPSALVAIALTGSRAGSLVAAIACLALLLLSTGKIGMKVATVAVLAVGIYIGFQYVPRHTQDRVFTATADLGDMNSRVSTWKAGIRVVPSYLMLGAGAGAFPLASGSGLVAHNTFLSVLLEEGFVGFSLFLTTIILLFHSVWRTRPPDRTIWIMILICWCVGVNSLTWEQTRLTWAIFALAAAQTQFTRNSSTFFSSYASRKGWLHSCG